MKTHLRRLAAATFFIFAVAQQNLPVDKAFVKQHALEMYEMNLQRSDIPGIIEATLYDVVECKNRFPDLDYSRLLNAVNKVSQESDDISIGYKAHLASMYLTHSLEIQIAPVQDPDDHEYLFKQIADQLEKKYSRDQQLSEHGKQKMMSDCVR